MFKGFGRSGGRGAMAAGAFAALVLALGAWLGSSRDESGEAPDAVAVAPIPEADPQNAALEPDAVQGVSVGPEGAAATEPRPQEQQEAEAPAPQPPAFDEVRRESDGMTVIAGRAAPGSSVAVLKDGEEVARATADTSGKFATLAMIPPDGAGHVLTLLVQDGEEVTASEEEIILAPLAAPAPIELAEADVPSEEPRPGVADTETPAESESANDAATEVAPRSETESEPQSEPENAPETATPLAGTGTAGQDDAEAVAQDGDSTPAQATPLAGTATAEAQADASAEAAEDAQTAQTDGSAAVETPLAGTGTAETAADSAAATDADNATPAEATPLAETGAASATDGGTSTAEATTPQAEATPLAETGTAEATENAAAANPASDTPETAQAAAPAEATPLAETGTAAAEGSTTADAETPAAADDGAPAGADGANEAAPAPQVAETTPERPERPETRDAPDMPNETAQSDDSSTTAPAKPPAPTPAEAPVAVLKSTAEGVERIDTAPPQVMTNVALDTIGYSDRGDVQLAGRAQPDTREVRVYLDNNAIISLPVDPEGRWRGDLPDVDEGVYTLRVDELSAGGDVTSRVETPFKRESPETLAAASAGLDGPLGVVTVQKGDTLWAISRERYDDPFLYVKVFEANSDHIRDPDLIYPGQVFDLPEQPASE